MKLKYLSFLPVVIIMGVIFYFSSRPSNESDESSMTIANSIVTIYEKVSEVNLQEEVRNQKLFSINHFVRKTAHFLEYSILAFAIAFHLWVWGKRRFQLLFLSVIFATLYAITDEIHQIYIPGRSGEIRDVLIDMSGAVLGVLVFAVLFQKRIYTSESSQEV